MSAEKLPPPTVLIVDDEPLIRWSLSEGLGELGYVVRQASSRAEARAVLAAAGADPLIVLLDLRLPDSADLGLLAEIRRTLPHVPVIVMSAHGTPEIVAEARALGACRFVDKPFDVGQVVGLVGDAWLHNVR